METIVVFVDDADHARALLQPMIADAGPARWIVVGCAPRLTRRIGKWVAHSAREQWREKWCERLFAALRPLWSEAAELETLVAKHPLQKVTEALRARHGGALRVLDARRPKLGQLPEPVAAAQPVEQSGRWSSSIAVTSGMCAMLALVD